jgi:release factor glutamine methyltransferase
MTISEARQKILNELKDVYDKVEALNVAELVLEKVSNQERTDWLKNKDLFLSPEQIEELKKILIRLKDNEPVQYALEEAWFAGMKFKVNKNVLIPRPETEELVDWIVKEINIQYSTPNVQYSILDIGTGSGCIPIALKKKIPKASVTAIDICSEALHIALENAVAFNTEIDFRLMDFLDEEKWNELGKFDIIVSNPPYVMQTEKVIMHPRVTVYEPPLALFVPDDDALIFYKKLVRFSLLHLNKNGKLFVEINESLGKDVVELFMKKGFTSIELKKDMQGKDRMVRAVFNS